MDYFKALGNLVVWERGSCMRHSKFSRKLILPMVISILIMSSIIITVGAMVEIWIDFQAFGSDVLKDLNSPETKAYMRNQINGTFSPHELLNWTNQHLKWANGSFTRYAKPEQILEEKEGMCQEFAIIYVAACLASGYEARLIVSRQFYRPEFGLHAWAEVKLNGIWIQADPSPTPFWNDTSHYKNWQWGSKLTLRIYAFEDGRIEDVTARYRYDGGMRPILNALRHGGVHI